jgi:hypothetical protein
MNNEERILGKLTEMDGRFDRIEGNFDHINKNFQQIGVNFEQIDARFDRIDARMDGMDLRMDGMDIFMREGLVSRDEGDRIIEKLIEMDDHIHRKLVTKTEFMERIDRLTDQVEGFVRLHTGHDVELMALRSKTDRLDERLTRVEAKV